MSSENAIELKNIVKTFRIYHEKRNSVFEYLTSSFKRNNNFEELTVLDDVSLSVKKGEMIGIIGMNGSGKTTLLKIIAKIYTPNKGTVNTSGRITPLLELGTGFNGEFTARDNIIVYGSILGFNKNAIEKKIDDIIRFAELEKFADTKLKNFSSGMNARLAFATAIQVDPDILLVDEVLSVGDITFKEKSSKAFLEFKKKGKTIVFVSHSIEELRKSCDRFILLHNGVIHSQGKPDDVIEAYKKIAFERAQ